MARRLPSWWCGLGRLLGLSVHGSSDREERTEPRGPGAPAALSFAHFPFLPFLAQFYHLSRPSCGPASHVRRPCKLPHPSIPLSNDI